MPPVADRTRGWRMSAPLFAHVAHMLFSFLAHEPCTCLLIHVYYLWEQGGLPLTHQSRSSWIFHPDSIGWNVKPSAILSVGWGSIQLVSSHGRRAAGLAPHKHHLVSSVAIMYFISLYLMEGKPPLAQESACSTVKCLQCHSHRWRARCLVASPTWRQEHHRK